MGDVKRRWEDRHWTRLGWDILTGADTRPRSYNDMVRATEAAHRDAQYREVSIHEEILRQARAEVG